MLSYLMVCILLVKLSRALLMKITASMSFFWSLWYRMSTCDRFLLILVLEVLIVLMPIYLNWIVDLKELLSETQQNYTLAAMLKLASDLIEDIPSRSLLSYV